MQTLVMNGMQESVPEITQFPAEQVTQVGEEGRTVAVASGLEEALIEGYESGQLPSELGYSWAKAGDTVDLSSYTRFPQGN